MKKTSFHFQFLIFFFSFFIFLQRFPFTNVQPQKSTELPNMIYLNSGVFGYNDKGKMLGCWIWGGTEGEPNESLLLPLTLISTNMCTNIFFLLNVLMKNKYITIFLSVSIFPHFPHHHLHLIFFHIFPPSCIHIL